jgi:hypothetical protein
MRPPILKLYSDVVNFFIFRVMITAAASFLIFGSSDFGHKRSKYYDFTTTNWTALDIQRPTKPMATSAV